MIRKYYEVRLSSSSFTVSRLRTHNWPNNPLDKNVKIVYNIYYRLPLGEHITREVKLLFALLVYGFEILLLFAFLVTGVLSIIGVVPLYIPARIIASFFILGALITLYELNHSYVCDESEQDDLSMQNSNTDSHHTPT